MSHYTFVFLDNYQIPYVMHAQVISTNSCVNIVIVLFFFACIINMYSRMALV